MTDDLAWFDATELAELVHARKVSPVELVDAAIERVERLDPALNAVIHRSFERARRLAASADLDAPLAGVPFLIKDAVCQTAGEPYHFGARFLRDAGWLASHDTVLSSRFHAAGLVPIGRTNSPEFAASATTEPLAYGPTRNPWDTGRSPGGSSGGSAAAVASGMVPLAHGNDMGGSIRIPAGWCGLVGLKPTRARTGLGPARGEYWSILTHEHVLSRSVRDTAAVLDAVSGFEPGDPYTAPPPRRPFVEEVGAPAGRLRIGVRTRRLDTGAAVHPECAAAVAAAAGLLEAQGHALDEDPLAELETWDGIVGMGTVVAAWVAHEIEHWSATLGRTVALHELEPQTASMVERGRAMTAGEYLRGVELLHTYARRASGWTRRFDLLLLPTAPTPPPPLGVLGPLQQEDHPEYDRRGPAVFTLPFDITGEPAVSLPLHWTSDGLPVGVQLVAPYGREDQLLRVASALEAARPWRPRRPPVAWPAQGETV
jgi:amidase